MPVVYDFRCQNEACSKRGVRFESLLKSWQSPDPVCPGCGQVLERQFPAPRLGWVTKPWTDLDLREEHVASRNYCREGVWATRRKTSSRPDGSPEPVLIKSRQEMKQFCEAEGYFNPEDLPPHLEIDADGKTLRSSGHSGQWV